MLLLLFMSPNELLPAWILNDNDDMRNTSLSQSFSICSTVDVGEATENRNQDHAEGGTGTVAVTRTTATI